MKKNLNDGRLLCFTLLFLFLSAAAEASAGQASLAWNPNSETDLAGYKIYYGKSPGNYETPIDVGNQTQHTITGLSAGIYYFAVSAYDTSGNQSPFSNEVSANVQETSAGGFGSQPTGIANDGSPSAGGCGFIKRENSSITNQMDIALFLIPFLLGLRSLFGKKILLDRSTKFAFNKVG